jgi:hypothetical protein
MAASHVIGLTYSRQGPSADDRQARGGRREGLSVNDILTNFSSVAALILDMWSTA